MSLVLLSESNIHHKKEVINMINDLAPSGSSILYVASGPDPQGGLFKKYVEILFSDLGFHKGYHLGLEDEEWQTLDFEKLKAFDAVFLSGGDTYRFLYWLKKRGLVDLLKYYIENKVLIGVSAGAMVLMPDILLASDEKSPEYSDEIGLGLLDYYVKPHYQDSLANRNSIEISKNSLLRPALPIYCIPNAGMMIDAGGNIEVSGDVVII